MKSEVFKNVVVVKPWGMEWLLYATPQVELWYLRLDRGASTSLHCHPTKKTGLVVLDGSARVSFLNDSVVVGKLGKVMIRPGLFHQTTCLGDGQLSLLEIETPPDKGDLVRLEDQYGRAGQPYEPPERYVPDLSQIRLTELDRTYLLDGCELCVTRRDVAGDGQAAETLVMVLAGGLAVPGDTSKYVLSAGDVVSLATFRRLARSFRNLNLETLVLSLPALEVGDGRSSGDLAPDLSGAGF